jgi:50S ribosomal protein L16 3-hydroxylase
MLSHWFSPDDPTWFSRTQLGRAPFARPGGAASAIPLFGWAILGDILKRRAPMDLITVAGGRIVEAPVPRSPEDVTALMRAGVSVVIRSAEDHDEGLALLADSFTRELGGEVHVQLYVTPANTASYGWHFDFEDVFIAQTSGTKDYYMRPNTVADEAVLGDPLDFQVIRRESSPISVATLIPGDCLYIPAKWWHLVKCTEDAFSISVGVMSPQALRSARRLPRGWSGRSRTVPPSG